MNAGAQLALLPLPPFDSLGPSAHEAAYFRDFPAQLIALTDTL